MFILGFDLASYKAGVGVGDIRTGQIIHFAKIETDSALSDEDRAEEIVDRVLTLIKHYQPIRVGLENNRISYGGHNIGLQEYYSHGNMRVIHRYCRKKGITVRWRTRQQMYVAVLGRGRGKADKNVLMAYFQGLGYAVENDDQSDGCGHAWAEMKSHGIIK
jgi:Holliday junction resolvasome RuvABC endonuclease subunit